MESMTGRKGFLYVAKLWRLCNVGAVIVSVAIWISGCATPLAANQVQVEFKSTPPGALIYGPDGVAWGVAPQSRVWTFPNAQTPSIVEVTAVWRSGARKTDRIDLRKGPQLGEWTFSRPLNAPNLNLDLPAQGQKTQTSCTQIGSQMFCDTE